MFTLNRLSLLGLGAGLVVVGCASPTDATTDETGQSTDALSADAEQAAPVEGQSAALEAQDFAGVDSRATVSDEQGQPDDEGTVEKKADKIIIGPWGGLGWAGGYGRFGGLGWGGGWGVPFGGVYGVGVPGYAWGGLYPYGAGYAVGYGSSYTCGLYGCFGGVW